MKSQRMTDNVILQNLIKDLHVLASEQKVPLWQRIAHDLERPTRQRRIVNLTRISKYTKPGETIIVPGKVLGTGDMDHDLHIAAFSFSEGAREKITGQKGSCLTITELIRKNPKGQKVRIIG